MFSLLLSVRHGAAGVREGRLHAVGRLPPGVAQVRQLGQIQRYVRRQPLVHTHLLFLPAQNQTSPAVKPMSAHCLPTVQGSCFRFWSYSIHTRQFSSHIILPTCICVTHRHGTDRYGSTHILNAREYKLTKRVLISQDDFVQGTFRTPMHRCNINKRPAGVVMTRQNIKQNGQNNRP